MPRHESEKNERLREITRVFQEAVKEAREESRRMGVANVTEINGEIWYELPNGELTREQPEAFKKIDLNGKK